MKLAFATTFSADDVNNWSGTPYYMSQAFVDAGCEVTRMGDFKRKLPPFFKLNQAWKKFSCAQRESPRFNIVAAKHYSEQLASRLQQTSVDAIIAPQINPVAFLESKKPLVLWTDALYASLVGFYPSFCNHSANSITQGNAITQECIARSQLLIFSSDWAARGAMEFYGADQRKIHVVPFGANLIKSPTLADIREMIKNRSRDTVKLLFLGKHWDRKGGDIVFNAAKALHAAGQKVEVNFVGCHPPKDVIVPDYIKCHGFISKRTPEGVEKITSLLRESHFLFVPSRAEAYGIVFCEANAFGLPCLTSYAGGISTIVKDNVNGMTFSLNAKPEVYSQYIMDLMQNYSRYEEMALAAFNEFETRLNWRVAVGKVKQLIQETR